MSMINTSKPRILVFTGATASGKTGLALQVAGNLPCEIVCMDSMQIYKRMDIGTAKPTAAEQAVAPHHMLDIIEPDAAFSVAEYVDRTHKVIAGILKRGRIPVLVGGTGLYLQGLSLPMNYGGLPSDPAVRQELTAEMEQLGAQLMHERLSMIDPPTAARLHPNDTRRVIRALEIYRLTGIPMSQHKTPTDADSPYNFSVYAIDWDRHILHERINTRVDFMMKEGLFEEVRALIASGVPATAQSMQGLGYKELLPALNKEISLKEAVEQIKTGTRNYARRQLIWFRRDQRVHWIASNQINNVANDIIAEWKD
ncbi:MAG: tRNA (adenosine(37)-N6)-dimethylallyltransferase MiaA [Clostridia bacterium]|nr:tRNA (adenosine(37)-N6)-dimethylallyltransferase MiaA [Clostridia bacterium]